MWIISDFDGTLAHFSPDPDTVDIHQESIEALLQLSHNPNNYVAILTGRSLESIDKLALPDAFIIAGSHGAELRAGTAHPDFNLNDNPHISALMDPSLQGKKEALRQDLERLSHKHEGTWVENKPFHLVFHYRSAHNEEAVLEALSHIDPRGTHVVPGKKVIEFATTTVTKGTWVQAAREKVPGPVIFLGDDLPDEAAFAVLLPGDRGIKIGEGTTYATERVGSIEEAGALLTELAQQYA